ncbi:MAG: surE [Parachlamydiales bacterium]|nr:surE [Parachlamydiales bacterium]
MTRPFILITNDDGIQAEGIRHLWDATRDFADLAIVSPHTEKSGSSLSFTWTKPLTIREYAWDDATPAWSINGTPTDCVKMAISVLLTRRPDLIISGVNRGSNAGRTVLYSGTIGGVIEGVMRDIPGIAFSFSEPSFPALGVVKNYISTIVKHFIDHPIPTGSFLNVNFPLLDGPGIQGIRMARQGRGYWMEKPDKRLHPEGSPYYWLGGQWSTHDEVSDSDVILLQKGYITAVPICVGDLTDHRLLKQHEDAILSLDGNI